MPVKMYKTKKDLRGGREGERRGSGGGAERGEGEKKGGRGRAEGINDSKW